MLLSAEKDTRKVVPFQIFCLLSSFSAQEWWFVVEAAVETVVEAAVGGWGVVAATTVATAVIMAVTALLWLPPGDCRCSRRVPR